MSREELAPRAPSRPIGGDHRHRRAWRRRTALELAASFGGVVHRRDLRAVGIGRDEVRSEIRGGRWQQLRRNTICIEAPLQPEEASPAARSGSAPARWRDGEPSSSCIALRPAGWPAAAAWAVWESGSGAVLDGISALLLDGLVNYAEERIFVTVPRGRRPVRLPGVVLHTQRTVAAAPGSGLPRVRTETAVVNAVGWARSRRQAALIVVLAVQQGLTTASRLMAEVACRGRVHRRGFLFRLLRDVQGGVRALGELDFARLCRAHGIPPPSRQRVRSGPRGRIYLDAWWEEYQVGVEIDGVQHLQGLHPVADALRDNDVLLSGGPTLRIPSLGLITEPAAFMAQVDKLLARHGR